MTTEFVVVSLAEIITQIKEVCNMKLSETTFQEFIDYCKREKKNWYVYMTIPKLKIIYDYCVKHNLKTEGQRMRTTWKGNEFISSFSSPIELKLTRDDYADNLFHEVWCKAEWAIRCSRSETELGYSSVRDVFGMATIKALKEAN